MKVGKREGFSLLEMIIAIGVTAIIISGMVYYGKGIVEETKALNSIAFIGELRKAFQRYYMNHGKYPTSVSQVRNYIKLNPPEGTKIQGYTNNFPFAGPCYHSVVVGYWVFDKDVREKFVEELKKRGWYCTPESGIPEKIRVLLAP